MVYSGTGQSISTPPPERTKVPQVLARRSEALEEPREHRLTGDALLAKDQLPWVVARKLTVENGSGGRSAAFHHTPNLK